MKKKLVVTCGVLVICIMVLMVIMAIRGTRSVQIGFSENTYGKQVSASFKYFDGVKKEKIKLGKNSKFVISYDLSLKSGQLKLEVIDEDGNVIEEKNAPDKGKFDITADKKQKYVLRFTGKKAKGKYKVNWKES